MKIEVTCDECESMFKLEYDAKDTDGDPVHCPFCGEELNEDEIVEEEPSDDFSEWEE